MGKGRLKLTTQAYDPSLLLIHWKQGYDDGESGIGNRFSDGEANRAYHLGITKRVKDDREKDRRRAKMTA